MIRFDRIVYMSCCPETLARDVSMLSRTHDVTQLAVFDHFPHTDRLEVGLMLQRSEQTEASLSAVACVGAETGLGVPTATSIDRATE